MCLNRESRLAQTKIRTEGLKPARIYEYCLNIHLTFTFRPSYPNVDADSPTYFHFKWPSMGECSSFRPWNVTLNGMWTSRLADIDYWIRMKFGMWRVTLPYLCAHRIIVTYTSLHVTNGLLQGTNLVAIICMKSFFKENWLGSILPSHRQWALQCMEREFNWL